MCSKFKKEDLWREIYIRGESGNREMGNENPLYLGEDKSNGGEQDR